MFELLVVIGLIIFICFMVFLTLVALGLWAFFGGQKTLREELFG